MNLRALSTRIASGRSAVFGAHFPCSAEIRRAVMLREIDVLRSVEAI
jgi:hypothetical protein